MQAAEHTGHVTHSAPPYGRCRVDHSGHCSAVSCHKAAAFSAASTCFVVRITADLRFTKGHYTCIVADNAAGSEVLLGAHQDEPLRHALGSNRKMLVMGTYDALLYIEWMCALEQIVHFKFRMCIAGLYYALQ